jgi:putative ABC transport system permease protein
MIFAMGLVLALVVGTAIVYLILSNDVANHLAEYATLKAMGYSGGYLVGVVLRQAVTLAFAGFLPGVGISVALYWVTSTVARLPIKMEWLCILFVLGLTVVMCVASGVGALRKLRAAEPADLF